MIYIRNWKTNFITMDLEQQINLTKKLADSCKNDLHYQSGTKFYLSVLNSLTVLRDTFAGSQNGIIVHMSVEDYRLFQTLKKTQNEKSDKQK